MPDEAAQAAKHMDGGELDGQFLKVKVGFGRVSPALDRFMVWRGLLYPLCWSTVMVRGDSIWREMFVKAVARALISSRTDDAFCGAGVSLHRLF